MKSTDDLNNSSARSNVLHLPTMNGELMIKLCILVSVFIFAIGKVLPVMTTIWSRPDYSHGFLIPFISLYMIWIRRENLAALPAVPNFAGGAAILILGSLALILGNIGSVALVQLSSIIVIIIGLILLLLGTGYLKALSFPVAYLVLSVPALDLVYDKISFPLQLFFAKSAAISLKMCNVPVFQHAQYLELPSVMLEVAPGCSGISFLVSFVAIGIPLALFTQKSLVRRAALVTFAVFCCFAANLLRIFLIGFWSYHGGEFVHGPFHIFVGAFISVVGFIFLFAAAWFFAETKPRKSKEELTTETISMPAIADMKRFNLALIVSVIILLSVGGYLYGYDPEPVQLGHLKELDLTIGEWKGSYSGMSIRSIKVRGADSETSRAYEDSKGRKVNLYVGYFASQTQGKEMVFYTLQELYRDTEETLVVFGADQKVRVNKALIASGSERVIPVLYWYDINGRIITNRYLAKFTTALNGLFLSGTNGALVMVYGDERSADKIEEALHDEMDFTRELMPALAKYLPGY